MTQSPQPNWFKHALEPGAWRDQQQAGSLALAVVVIVAVIGAIYLAQASATAAAGRRLQVMEARRQVLEQQNAQLRAEIAALRSVPRLTAESELMGFRTATAEDVEYLELNGVAPPPDTEMIDPISSLAAAQEETVPTYDETLESWLFDQLATFRGQMEALFASFKTGEEDR